MEVNRKHILKVMKSIKKPIIIDEATHVDGANFRVLSKKGGYRWETDEYPIDGPFNIFDDVYQEALKVVRGDEDAERYYEVDQNLIEMVELGCKPDIDYYRYRVSGIRPQPALGDLDDLEAMLVKDAMKNLDCETWDDMSDEELEDWYQHYEYAEA